MSPAPRYTVVKSLADCRGTRLFRAVRNADRRPVILKVLDPRRCRAQDIECLKHEYEIGRVLDTEGAVKPLALDAYRGLPALVLEDSGDESLDHLLGAPMEIGLFLRLAIAIAAAVAEIHRQEVIHKDLKPRNILVNPARDEVKITDFGIASRLARELRPAQPPRLIEGSLPYLSPEQTGRTNRILDNRTDLYSLGVTFYEMLTGQLPFEAHDPVEWVHCHVARAPPSPAEIVPEIPGMIASIVLKLLSKMPEDRYQSARGLRLDLERCLEQWSASGKIEPFESGAHDATGRLQIPQKLYGREAEIAHLLRAFSRVVTTGIPELLLVSGYSGIGKSSLVQELYKPVVRERAFFLSGKFDQYKRDIPYATIAQAFRELVLEVLAESEPKIAALRQRLLSALGINAQLIVEVIPPVELVIGRQPPVPELPPTEAQNRFLLVLRQFIGVFAQKEHPLTLFLDDLQWADSASLGLLEGLVASSDVRHLLLIGAYRDNEVSPSHPLMLTLDEVRKRGARVSNIALGPIPHERLAEFVSEALHCSAEDAAPLSDLVYEKTAGNPFFAIQFLLSLHEERLIEFDATAGAFRWDMASIRAKAFTDNVVDLMVGKLLRLPPATQEALKQLACLGNSAEVALLAMVHGRSEPDTHADLWEAARAGLVLRVDGKYKFLHDRVQQGAYALIEDDRKKELHVRIGRLLLASVDARGLEEKIFDIVNQLDHGVDLITDRAERDELARLNFIAGRKAKAAIAYASAQSFLATATALLPEDAWESRYDVLFPLFMERAECEYLCGAFERAEALFDLLFARSRTDFDKAKVYELRLKLCHVAGKYDEAVAMAVKALHLFGVDIPEDDEALSRAIRAETEAIEVNLGGRRIADLADAPEATDPSVRAVIGLLSNVTAAAYIGSRPQLFPLVILKLVNHSLRFGHTHESCTGYSAYGLMLVSLFDDPRSAYEFSEMSIKLNQKLGDISRRGTVLHLHGDHINFWIHPIATDFPILERGFLACLDAGDLVYASYIAFEIVWQAVERGDTLDEVLELSRRYASFARDSRNESVYQTIRLEQQFLACLKGQTRGSATFDDESFEEAPCLAKIAEASFQCGIVFCHVMKLIMAYLFGQESEALRHADEAKKTLSAAMAMPMEATFYFFHALVLADIHPRADEEARREIAMTLEHHQKKLGFWAKSCPENFLAKYALVSAEIARISGDELEAERRYEEAIRSARESGFVHWEGLAGELAGRFYRDRGFEIPANAYLREALHCYVRWGAAAKVRQLEQRYPQLREVTPAGPAATFAAEPEQLDLLSVVKALQSISSEILLPKLSETLLQIMLQQAGGQRAALLLVRDDELAVQAEATTDGNEIRVESLHGAPASADAFPISILHYVARTREPVILNDAVTSARFASDEHILRRHPRSLLCFPIVRQARVSGLVYLENNLVTAAFTPDTIHVLELLGAQAAISLDNATLYADLERSRREIAAVLDNMVDSVVVVDRTGQVTLVNQAAAHLVGLASPAEALGPVSDLARRLRVTYPSSTPRDARQIPILRALGGETVPLDEGMFSLPGSARIRYLHTSASPIRDAGARVVGAVAVLRDVTELVELDRLKDQFLCVAAHELKTPVAVVMGYAETLSRMAKELAPNQRRMLDGLLRGAGRIDRIVADLLFLSQVQLDRLSLVMEQVDLGELVDRAAARASRAAPARRVQVTRAEPVVIQGDRELLGRVVAHLIDNALRYSPEGGDVEVDVRIIDAQDAIVSVRDHGVGIPAGKSSRIFECFYRAHTDTCHDYGGMGTGLYLSRAVVARHGGEMWFESEEGRGSTFHVRLPLTHEDATAPRR